MVTYYQALQATEYLLDKAGDTNWRDWLRDDIRRWESDRDTEHHLQAYGGQGSFNDVVLWRVNGYQVAEAQEVWVQGLFEMLRGMCFRLAQQPHVDEPLSSVLSSGTRDLPILEGFQHDRSDESRLADLSRYLGQLSTQLHGWRCLDCGFAETSPRQIEQFLVQAVLPSATASLGEASGLLAVVDAAFAMDFPGLQASREQVTTAARSGQIDVRDRGGWMRPCPQCQSNHTAIYRWEYSADASSFRPALDNLPMRDANT